MIARITRLIAGLALVLGTLLAPQAAFAAPTGATLLDCKEAPTPEAPGAGVGGWFINEPTKAPAGESWVNGQPSMAHYGYAGLRWNTYDLGCGADLARNPGAVIGNEIGNWLFYLPKFMVGLTNFVVHYAFHPTFLDVFNPLVVKATGALRAALFNQWAVVFLAFAGLAVLWKFKSLRVSSALTMVGWAVAVMTLAVAVFSWPLLAGQTTDKVVTTVLGAVNRSINGTGSQGLDPADEVAQNLTATVLYQQWKAGEFGDANSAIANKYARPMWESQTLTWADKQLIAKDPDGAGKRLLDYKKKQFEDTAAKIKDEDPTTYEYIQGKRGEDRFGAAFMALFGAVVTIPFLLVSCLLVLGCFMIVRFAVIFFPAIATLAVNYQFRSMLKGLLNAVAAAVVNSIVFGAGAAITILSIGVLMSPDNKLPIPLRFLLIALTTVIMWVVLKPFRKLTQMVGKNHNPFRDATDALGDQAHDAQRGLMRLGKQVIASYAGNKLALRSNDKRRAKEEAEEGETKLAEETTVAEPEITVVQVPRTEQEEATGLPAREPVAAIGTRPAEPEPAPYERPAAEQPEPVDGTPVRDQVATRPSHNEVGPYEASETGGAVTPVQVTTGAPDEQAQEPPVVRPEYAGGTVVPEQPAARQQARDDVWQPGDPEPVRDGAADIVDLRGTATIDESGQEVWPVFNPDSGIRLDAQSVEFGEYQPTNGPAPSTGSGGPAAPAGDGE